MADEGGDVTTFTQEQVDALVTERLASAKAEGDVAFKNLWDEAKAAKDKLRAFDGIDPEEHQGLKDAAAELAKKKAEAEGDWEAREKQLVELHGKETETLNGKLDAAQTSIERFLVDSVAVAAIADAKGSSKVLLPHVKAHVRVVEKDGEHAVQIINDKGMERFSDGEGTPMTIENYVAELRQDPDFARNFEGSGSSGGGSSKSSGGAGGGVTHIDAGDMHKNLDGIIDGTVQVEGWPATT